MRTLFIILFTINLNSVWADILFVDLNFSTKEVETARKAALLRGEELIVFPEVSDINRKTLNEKKALLLHLQEENLKLQTQIFNEQNIEKKLALNTQAKEISLQWKEQNNLFQTLIRSSGNTFTPEKLKEFIGQKGLQGKNFSSMIVSSHHSGKSFFGHSGSIDEEEFKSIINGAPKVFGTMHSIYLWGCYTATKNEILAWKGIVPSAYIIAGWDGSAPKEDKPINHDFLVRLLAKESEISAGTTLKKAVSIFRAIPKISNSSAAYCIGNAYVSNNQVELLTENLLCPNTDLEKLKTMKFEVEKFLKATELNFEDVPENTQTSVLREAYTLGRRMEHCQDPRAMTSQDLDNLIKLIFDRQVRKNFSTAYESDIDECKAILKLMNLPENLVIPDFGNDNTSRKNILNFSKFLTEYLQKHSELVSQNQLKLKMLNNKINKIIANHECINPIWVEDVDAKTLHDNVDDSCLSKTETISDKK